MGRTALSGATGVFAAMVLGGGAQAGPTGASTPAAVANAPGITTSGATTDVTLNQSRTIIDWKSLDVGKDETLNFRFSDKSWIVLNRTPGVARIDGALNGCVVTCGTVGGNVWIFGAGGVLFGPNARVNVGSLLATTTPISSEMDFLSGRSTNFEFKGGADLANVQVQAGAQIAAHGGALALVAPQVETQAGSSLSARGAVLVGAAQTYRIRFDASAGGGLDLLDFEVPASAMEDGTVSATPIAVNGAVSGARVVLAAISRPTVMNAVISLGGVVTASAAAPGEGGSIVLTGSGSAGSKVDVSGALVAHGGKVDVTAPSVGVEGRIDVSAPAGGGAVRIGGGAAGQDATIANAQTVTLAPGSTVDASATAAGRGGSVTVWSDRATDFRGSILARGGPAGGDGGAVEVSGGWLNYGGFADLRAPLGTTGTLLLDPDNIEILHGANTTTTPPGGAAGALSGTVTDVANTPGADPSLTYFNENTINGALGTANVTISTAHNGTISFTEAGGGYAFNGLVGAPGGPVHTLTFSAQGGFLFTAADAIAVTDANLVLNAGTHPLDLTAAITSTAAVPLTNSAGNVSLIGGAITLDATVSAGTGGRGGAVSLLSSGAISQTAAITAHTVNAGSTTAGVDLSGTNAVDQLGNGSTAANGNYSFKTSLALAVTGAVNVNGAGVLSLVSGGAITEGAGGSIATSSLTGSSVGGATLAQAANSFTGVGAFTNAASGALDLESGGALAVTAAVSSAGTTKLSGAGLTVAATGSVTGDTLTNLVSTGANALNILGAVGATGAGSPTVQLNAAGAITESGTGAITANTLSFAATGAGSAVSLTGANSLTTLAASSSGTGLAATTAVTAAGSYTVSGPITSGGNLTLRSTGGDLTLASAQSSPGLLALFAPAGTLTTAAVSATGDYAVDATTFAGQALSPTLGAASSFSVTARGGDFSLSSLGTTTVPGALSVNVTAGNLGGGGTTAGAYVLRGAGVATTGPLAFGAGGGNASITSTAGAISIGGAIDTGSATDAHTLSLSATGGGIGQTGGSALTTGKLDAQATGAVALNEPTNAVGELVHLTGAGASFVDAASGGLTVDAADAGAGALSIVNSGKLTVSGATLGAGTALFRSTAADVEFPNALTLGGTTTVTGATNATFDSTIDGPHDLTVNPGSGAAIVKGTVGGLAAPTSLTVNGAATLSADVTTGTGGLLITGLSTLATATVTLGSTGPIAIAGADSDSAATPRTLIVSTTDTTDPLPFQSTAALGPANGLAGFGLTAELASFTGTNKVATLATDTTFGVTFADAVPTLTIGTVGTVSGITTTNSSTTLSNDNGGHTVGAIQINQPIALGTGSLSLTSGLGMAQGAAGTITAQGLAISTRGDATLTNAGNAVGQVTGLTTNGAAAAIAFTDSQALTLPNPVTVGGALTLTTTAGGITTGDVTATGVLTLSAKGTLGTGALRGFSNVALTAGAGTSGGAALTTGTVTVDGAYAIDAASFNTAALNPVFPVTPTTANSFSLTQRTGSINTGAIAISSIGGDYTIAATNGSVTGNGSVSGRSVTVSGQAVQVGNLTATGGDVTLTSTAGPVELTGAVNAGLISAGHTVTLSATGGAITQDAGATITGGRLDAAASGGVTLGLANAVGELVRLVDTSPGPAGVGAAFNDAAANPGGLTVDKASSANGPVSITNTGDIKLEGDVSATGAVSASGHTATVTSSAGAVTQIAAGYVTAATLVASGATGVVLDTASNREVTSVSLDGGSGGARFLDTATGVLTATRATAQGDVALTNAAGLSLTGQVRATGAGAQVTLSALSGQIVESGTEGTDGIRADLLSAEARDGVLLGTLTNDVARIVRLANTGAGGAVFKGGIRDLTIGGAGASDPVVDGGTGNVSITDAGAIVLQGKVTAPTTGATKTVSLVAGGALTQTSAGLITGGTLTAAGVGAGPGLAVGLNQANNVVGEVTSLAATGAGGAALTLGTSGTLIDAASGGTGALRIDNTGALTLGGVLAAGSGAALTLNAGGEIKQTGGRLDGGSLSAVGGSGVHLTSTTNSIVTVTRLSDTGTTAAMGTTLGADYTGAGAVTVAQADTAAGPSAPAGTGDLTLRANGGALTLTGAVGVGATHTVSLTATGAVSQPGGAVSAGTVTGSGAGFSLTSAANAIGRLQAVSAGTGDLTLVDAAALTLGGALSGNGVSLTTTGSILQDPGSVITAGTLTGAGVGGLSLTGANAVATVTSLVDSGAGDVSFTNGTGALAVQTMTAAMGNLTLVTGGALSLTGALTAATTGPAQTATITAGNTVSQSSGASVVAGVLTGGTSAGAFVLDAAGNAYGKLGALSAPGAITLKDSAGLEAAGVVLAGGALTIAAPQLTLDAGASLGGSSAALTATGGGISLSGAISTPSGQTTLTASAGPITQVAPGTITAHAVQASAAGGITLVSVTTPAFVSLSNTGSGDIGVTLAGDVTSGAVSNTAGAVTVTDASGALNFTGGVSAQTALLLGAGGALTGTAATSSTSTVTLAAAGKTPGGQGIAFSGAVAGAGAVQATASAAGASATFGSLASAAGDVIVTTGAGPGVTGGAIGVSGALNVGRDLILTGASFTGGALAPTFAAGTGRDFLLTDTAGGLTYATLQAPRNLIVVAADPGAGDSAPISGGALSSAAGAIQLTGTSLNLTGGVSAPVGGVTLTATRGAVALGGAVGAGAQTVTITAGTSVAETGAGAITAGQLSVASNGAIDLRGANSVPVVASLANAGAGGVRFNDVASAVQIAGATTVGGDIALTAPSGALSVTSDLTAPGALTLSAGGALSAGALTAQSGALSATGAGVTLGGNAQASTDLTVAAGAGDASLQALSATTGALSVSGRGLTLGAASSGAGLALAGTGAVTSGALTAGGALQASGSSLTLGASTAGGAATLTSPGAATLTTLTGATGVSIDSAALQATTLAATTGVLRLRASTANLGTATSGGAVDAATTGDFTADTVGSGAALGLSAGGAATVRLLSAGTGLSLSGGSIDLTTGAAGGAAAVTSAGAVTIGGLTAATDLSLDAGALHATTLAATSGELRLRASTADLGSAAAGGVLDAATTSYLTADTLSSGGAFTLAAAGPATVRLLTAGGALTLSGSSIALTTGTSGAAATVTSAGPATIGGLTAATDLSLDTGVLQATTLAATGGALTLRASTATLGSATAGGAVDARTTGDLTAAALDAGGALTLVSGGAATVETATAGGALSGQAAGLLDVRTLTGGAGVTLTAGTLSLGDAAAAGTLSAASAGDAGVGTATAGGDLGIDVAGALAATSLTAGSGQAAGGPGSATIRAASLDVGTLKAALDGSVTTTSGAATLGTASAGRDLLLSLAGSLDAAALQVGRNLTAASPAAVTVGGIAAGSAGTVSISGQDVRLGAAAGATPGPGQALSAGAGVAVDIAASRDLALNLAGPASFTQLSAARDLSFATTGGDATAGSLSSGGALSVSAAGGSARIGTLALTGAGPATVAADQDVVLGQGFAGSTLSIPAALLTLDAGRDVIVAYPGAISLASVTAGRDIGVASASGQVDLPLLQAGRNVSVSGAGVAIGAVTAGGDVSAVDPGGAVTVDTADVGGDLTLTSTTGDASVRDVRMRGLTAGARTLTVTAAGQATVGRTSDTAAAGALTLDDASRTHVIVRSTGASGAAARIDVTGAATLAEATSASGDVIVKAAGAVTGAPTGSALFTANKALSVTSGGDIVMGGLSTAGGAALVDAQGTLTLASLTANTATLRATDLTLSGGLTATSACSPSCAAPTVVIESRKGALVVGDAAALGGAPAADASAFPSGGMTLDNAEVGRIRGDSVALYAGDTTNAAARGDIGVANLVLDGSAIRKLSLFAGPAATVTVGGEVTPATANVGDLVIGGAKSADGWTPKSIHVTGGLGKPGTGVTAVGNAALHSVELNGIKDVLIGGRTFVAAVTGAETADGANAITAINITRGLPIGVQPAIADLNRNIVTAGTLTLRSDGYVVQQNTGASGQQGGVLLTNPDKAPFVLTLGRVGGPSATGSLIPALIDLSISFVNSSGTLLNRQVAAASPSVDTSGLTRSDAYRINGCTIGTAGTCTPLPNTIVDIRINKLVEGVQIAAEDPPAIDDPTITGAGNEEIWRSPAPSCIPGKGRDCK